MNEPAQYVGFWKRVVAALVDTMAVGVSALVVLVPVVGVDDLFSADPAKLFTPSDLVQGIVGLVFVLGFWFYLSTTPGKLLFRAYIVDAETLRRPTRRQFVIRYVGYYVCILTLMLGILWVAFDRRKQGLHDKMAGTVVISGKPVDETHPT